ncbi:MAG: hypothetical protein ACK2UK_16610 [Candidatus Promineifilaceae bacterium]
MATVAEKNFENKADTMALATSQMGKWRAGMDRLDKELSSYPQEVQAAYRRDIGVLRNEYWEPVEAAFSSMDKAGQTAWTNAYHEWGRSAATFWQRLNALKLQIEDTHHVPLGWVEGMTDKRTYESAGWAEGMAARPAGSQGWAEGMGHQGDESTGWSEGYDSVNK